MRASTCLTGRARSQSVGGRAMSPETAALIAKPMITSETTRPSRNLLFQTLHSLRSAARRMFHSVDIQKRVLNF